jgi:hypothetical protein
LSKSRLGVGRRLRDARSQSTDIRAKASLLHSEIVLRIITRRPRRSRKVLGPLALWRICDPTHFAFEIFHKSFFPIFDHLSTILTRPEFFIVPLEIVALLLYVAGMCHLFILWQRSDIYQKSVNL